MYCAYCTGWWLICNFSLWSLVSYHVSVKLPLRPYDRMKALKKKQKLSNTYPGYSRWAIYTTRHIYFDKMLLDFARNIVALKKHTWDDMNDEHDEQKILHQLAHIYTFIKYIELNWAFNNMRECVVCNYKNVFGKKVEIKTFSGTKMFLSKAVLIADFSKMWSVN